MEKSNRTESQVNDNESGNTQNAGFKLAFGKMVKDMNFVGSFLVVFGIINCITIAGLLIGIPMVYAGLEMKGASDHFGVFKSTDQGKFLATGFEAQGKSFRIIKIIILSGIVIVLLSIITSVLFYFFHS